MFAIRLMACYISGSDDIQILLRMVLALRIRRIQQPDLFLSFFYW